MKASILALSTLLWAGPSIAGPCRLTKPSSTSVAAVSSSAVPSSSHAPASSPARSSAPSSSAAPPSSVVVVIPPSSPAPSSHAPSSVVKPSSSTSSSSALPSSSGGITSNPGKPSCSTDNLFKDSDLTLGLSYWPSNILTGSPTCSLGASCGTSPSGTAYAACLELDLVTLGSAEGIDFHQSVAVTKGTSYTGYFYYRLPSLGASGWSMATLTCTMGGETKFSRVLCADDVSPSWKKVSFAYTADCTDATFMCKVTTSAVTAKLQFTDFYFGAQC